MYFYKMHVTVDYVMLYMYAEKLNKFKNSNSKCICFYSTVQPKRNAQTKFSFN